MTIGKVLFVDEPPICVYVCVVCSRLKLVNTFAGCKTPLGRHAIGLIRGLLKVDYPHDLLNYGVCVDWCLKRPALDFAQRNKIVGVAWMCEDIYERAVAYRTFCSASDECPFTGGHLCWLARLRCLLFLLLVYYVV